LLSDIEQDRDSGATAEDRVRALKRAKSRSIALSTTAVIAAVATCFQRSPLRPPAAVVLALVPVAALYLLNTKPHLYALGKLKRDPRSELTIALIAPALGFLMSGVDLNLVSMTPLLPAMAVVVLAFVTGFYMLGRKVPQTAGFHALVLMCAGFYGYGMVASCDTLFDHGQPTAYRTQVAGKHIAHGKSTTYYLDFDAWGPLKGANKVSVPYGSYETAEPGDMACFEVHPGVLHAAWYMRVNCDTTEDTQTGP
jgi:hypothetical protein